MRALASLVAAALLAAAAPDEREGDSAPFMVLVRHGDGRACAAALVSLRTALTSAACAAPAVELWAVAPDEPAAARRVLRLVRAAAPPPAELAGDPWAGAGSDLALLELAEPLPARARAILMATDPADCAPPQVCHLVHALRRAPAGAARLRIEDARLEAGDVCATRGPRWPSLRAHTLCLAGPELCEADRGTGVVCGGKLCGVLARSAGSGGMRCGDVHAAASVPRWRRFLHCAHTRGACGRDGDCAVLCEERWLGEAPPEPAGEAGGVERRAPSAEPLQLAESTAPEPPAASSTPSSPTPSAPPDPGVDSPPQRTVPPALPPEPAAGAPLEFEPNRADFNTSASARVLLKAGEYDAPPEYAAPEEAARAPSPAPTPTPPRAASPPPPAPRTPAAPTRTPRLRMQVVSGATRARTALLPVLCAVTSVINKYNS